MSDSDYRDLKKLPLRVRKLARKLTKERWDREAAERDAKQGKALRLAAHARGYFVRAEIGLIMPRARFTDSTPLRLHVPRPAHIESMIWTILGDEAANDGS